jgi:hypothetical protein
VYPFPHLIYSRTLGLHPFVYSLSPIHAHAWNQCFFYWRLFFSKMLILAIFFKNSFSYRQNFHPIWPFFIKLWWFHPKSGRKCCTFNFIGTTCSINENLQEKHYLELFPRMQSMQVHDLAKDKLLLFTTRK